MELAPLTHVSLFSGIGGIDLAATWAGFRTVAMCERDPFCQRVLAKNFPGVPIYEDVKCFPSSAFRGVDLLTGGFPCQPFSAAGARGGASDDRYLWPEMLRVVAEARPAYVVGENVAGLLSMEDGIDRVLLDLESIGYEALPFVLPAAAVGAWHRRDRVFIVAADANRSGYEGRDVGCGDERRRGDNGALAQQLSAPDAPGSFGSRDCDVPTAAIADRGQAWEVPAGGAEPPVAYPDVEHGDARGFRERESIGYGAFEGMRSTHWSAWKHQPLVGRDPDGLPSGVDGDRLRRWFAKLPAEAAPLLRRALALYASHDRRRRLKALGNAVVPHQIYPVLEAIAQELRRTG